VGKTTSTHFAKQKLEQKQNSLHVKNFKVQKYIIIIHKTKIKKKTPQAFPRENFSFVKKRWGFLKKMNIFRNPPRLQVIQPYPTFRIWNENYG
jgi:hypothetical protein